jgi:predicted dinucleotide-binding enzyme
VSKLGSELGPNVTATTAEDAARSGEVVLEAIPVGKYQNLPAGALAGKLVGAPNHCPERDGEIDVQSGTQTPAQQVSTAAPALTWRLGRDRTTLKLCQAVMSCTF